MEVKESDKFKKLYGNNYIDKVWHPTGKREVLRGGYKLVERMQKDQ